MLLLLPASSSLLLGSSLRSAQPAGLSFAQERAAIRMSVTMDDTLRSVLKEMPTRWGENMDVRMERAQPVSYTHLTLPTKRIV